MRYHVLATDYDGTLAHDGKVDDATHAALERLRQSRRKLILVTGRRLEDLRAVFERIDLRPHRRRKRGADIQPRQPRRAAAGRSAAAAVQRKIARGRRVGG